MIENWIDGEHYSGGSVARPYQSALKFVDDKEMQI
jgi:hypothetical protein